METNPRGIPRAPFVVSIHVSSLDRLTFLQANVEEYVGGKDGEVESVMKTFQETSAYAFSAPLIMRPAEILLENTVTWNYPCNNVGRLCPAKSQISNRLSQWSNTSSYDVGKR
jgi:hypothetical protein